MNRTCFVRAVLLSGLWAAASISWSMPALAQAELCVIDTDCELNGTVCGTDICSWCATPGPGCAPTMTMTHNCVATSTGDPGWCDGASQALADTTCKCHMQGATCNLATHHCTSQKSGDGGTPPPRDAGTLSSSSGGGGPPDSGALGSSTSSSSSSSGGINSSASSSSGASMSSSSSSGAAVSSSSSSGTDDASGSGGTSANTGGSNAQPASGGCAAASSPSSSLGLGALGLALLLRLAANRRRSGSRNTPT